MIVIVKSLDTSIAGEKAKGCFEDIKSRYELFTEFGDVALLTQDWEDFSKALPRITHVPCTSSKSKTIGRMLRHSSYLRWSYFLLKSFSWLVSHHKDIAVLMSENIDSPVPLIVSMLFKIPYVIYCRYDVGQQVRWINKRSIIGTIILSEERFAFKRVKGLWVTSPHLVSMARSFGRRKPTTVVPNWIDPAETATTARGSGSNLAKGPRILFVGRPHPVKRVDLLVRALYVLQKKNPNVNLYLVGDGEELEQIRKLAASLNLTDKVHLLGGKERSTVFEMMKHSDVFVLCSKVEGNPRVLIEAMICKIPIVATNVPGIRDMVQHKKTGYLVSSDPEPEELAYAIEYVLENRHFAEAIVNRAYEFATQNFSKESALRKIRKELGFSRNESRTSE
jgi:glycosyltransferase involved in cell wall biosynthesis